MNTLESSLRPVRSAQPPSLRVLGALLQHLSIGRVELVAPDGARRGYGPGGAAAPNAKAGPAQLIMRDWSLAAEVLKGGDVAFAEAYIQGKWETPDLTLLLTVLAANQSALEAAFYGRWVTRMLLRAKHLLNTNTRLKARKNILAHYDLGNDFYGLWLDSTMTYSSALFNGDFAQPLPDAQRAKYGRIVAELALPRGARVLEIGCGWGGFAEVAAQAGHHVTGISLSDAQTAYARNRMTDAGLAAQTSLQLLDYRDVREQFDGIASIEMFEAVGERYWPGYFKTVRDALVPGGKACIQTITIADDRFERYRTSSDFIQQYIFPGGMLAGPSRFVAEAQRAGLHCANIHSFGRDYAETLKRWLAAFDAHVFSVRALGFDEGFIRCWRFYLAYCAAGFDTHTTDVAQYTFVRA